MANLYHGNGCKLAAAGGLQEGFSIRAAIRQGCPLSPLLFALCPDLMLRRLRRALPADLLRAYADDLALVAPDTPASAKVFIPISEEFALTSGLSLNLAKTMPLPRNYDSPEDLRWRLSASFPAWGAACCRGWAEYLGSTMGPWRGGSRLAEGLGKILGSGHPLGAARSGSTIH